MRDSGNPAQQTYAAGRLAGIKGGNADVGDFADDEHKINGQGGEKDIKTTDVAEGYSRSRYGHTFIKHGQNASFYSFNRVENRRNPPYEQGQWLDDAKAKQFLDDSASLMKYGYKTIPLPDWVPAVVWTRDGLVKATHARLFPGGKLYKTAYPTR